MDQPPRYTDLEFPQHVYRLKRALYGLKQAHRAWFHRFSSFFCSNLDFFPVRLILHYLSITPQLELFIYFFMLMTWS